MPTTNFQASALQRLSQMPDGVKLGSLSKGHFGSIVDNVFRNAVQVPWSSYNREDAQMVTGAEAYAYRPEVLRDTLLVMTVGQRSWLTARLAPVALIPETAKVLTWMVTKFKQSLATQVPNLGIPRLARHERIKMQAAVKRTGKAYTMEHDFMKTREGLRYHLAQLEQMANAMRDTIYYDIINTVSNAHEWELNYIRTKKLHSDKTPEQWFRKQIWAFAVLQKQKNAFPILATDIEEKMTYWGGEADIFIIPPQIIRYINNVPTENTSFLEAGPIGQQRLYDSLRPFAVSGVNDVFIARSYLQDELLGADQLLQDVKEFGEFYRMSSPDYDPDVDYRSHHCHIQVYSYQHDALVEIKLKTALENSHLFDLNGDPIYLAKISNGYAPYSRGGEHEGMDIFNYHTIDASTGRPKFLAAQYFGQMEPRYFTTEDKLYMARTVINALYTAMGKGCSKTLCDFNDGLDLIRRIQNIGPNDANLTIIAAIADGSGQSAPVRIAPLSPATGLPEYTQDPATGFLSAPPPGGTLTTLLPGLQSEAGLRYLVRYAGSELADEKRKADKFLSAARQIALHLDNFFPNNIALEDRFVSSVFQYPTATSALIDNLLTGGYNAPLFVRSGAGGADFVSVLQDRAANLLALSFNARASLVVEDTDEQQNFMFVMTAILSLAAAQITALPPLEIEAFNAAAQIVNNGAGARILSNIPAGQTLNEAADSRIEALLIVPRGADLFSGVADPARRAEFITALVKLADSIRANPENGSFLRTPFLVSQSFAQGLVTRPDARVRVGNPLMPTQPVGDAREALPMIVGSRSNEASKHGFATALMSSSMSMNLALLHAEGPMSSGQLSGEMQFEAVPSYTYPNRTPAARAAAYYAGSNPAVGIPAQNMVAFSETVRQAIAKTDAIFTENVQASWRSIDLYTPDPLLAAIMHIYDLTPIHKRAYEAWIEKNILLNIEFYVVRPHIRVTALDVIKVKAGSDTMMTGVSPGQFEVADDAATQSHFGTVTAKHVILMMKPENAFNFKGAMINGVLGGLGVNPINPIDYDMGLGRWPNQDIIYIPVSRRDRFDGNVLSLTGSLKTAETQVLSLLTDNAVLFETYPRLNRVYGFLQNRAGVNSEEAAVAALRDEYANVICLAGPHVKVVPRSGKFKCAHKGQSFLSGLISPKCGDLLSGNMVERDETAWHSYTVL